MLAGCAGVKSAFLIKRREAPHFLSVLSSVFGKKSGGIFIKPNLKAAENKGWRIRETISLDGRKKQYVRKTGNPYMVCVGGMKVKVQFTEGGISFDEAFENLLLSV